MPPNPQKWRAVVGLTAAILAVAAAVLYFRFRHSDDEVVAADASGSPPKLSGPLVGAPTPVVVPIYQGPPVVGFVQAAGGVPVAGARVMLATQRSHVGLALDRPNDTGRNVGISAADGRFEIAPDSIPLGLVVRCREGFAFASVSGLAKNPNVVVHPWGRLDAIVSIGPRSASHAALWFETDPQLLNANIELNWNVRGDDGGHFSLDFVPPGKIAFGVWAPGRRVLPRMCEVDIASGVTSRVRVGGNGRPVVGRVTPAPEAMNIRQVELRSSRTDPQCDRITADINSDGNFRLEDVPPGAYSMSVRCGFSNAPADQIVASAKSSLTVPSTGSSGDQPFDAGVVQMELGAAFGIAQSAPMLAGVDSAGKPVKLSDFFGRHVLLSIVWDPQAKTWMEIAQMCAIHDRFGDAIATPIFYAGGDFAQASQAAAQAGIRSGLVQIKLSANDLPGPYRRATHPTFLLDPQGKLLAPDLDSAAAFAAVDRVLTAHHGASPPTGATIRVEHLLPGQVTAEAPYNAVPPPSADDAATGATIALVDGQLPAGPNPIHSLNDGKMQDNDDQPGRSFRFAMGTLEGRVRFDLGQPVNIAQINSYSWHSDTRAPQVYQVFASNGDTLAFDIAPKIGVNPATCEWTKIAEVDTRPNSGPVGGRYAVSISSASGSLGAYRFLLFVMYPTETDDPNGHTFFGEIDVIGKK